MSAVPVVPIAGLTDAQKALRKTGIGSSEAAGLFGLDPRNPPIRIYERKLELVEDNDNPVMEWGRRLEAVVADAYAERTGFDVRSSGSTIRHPEHPCILATPDRFVYQNGKASHLLECKTADRSRADDWGEEGTDEIPENYYLQVMWQMLVTDLPACDLAVLIGGNDFRIYHIERGNDSSFESIIIEEARKFWQNHIIARVPPPIDSSQAYQDYLKRRYPAHKGEMKQADAVAEAWARRLQLACAAGDAAKASIEEAKAHLKDFIGDAMGVQGDFGRITWKKCKPSKKIDWQAVAQEVGAPPELIARHTTEKPGARVFLTRFKEEEK